MNHSPAATFALHCAGVIVVSRDMSLYSVPVSRWGTKISLFDMSGKDGMKGHLFARYRPPLLHCTRRVRAQHAARDGPHCIIAISGKRFFVENAKESRRIMDMVIRQGIFFVQCGECRAVLQFHIVAVDSHNPPRSTLHPNVGITPQVDPVAMGIRYRKNRLIIGYFRYGSIHR